MAQVLCMFYFLLGCHTKQDMCSTCNAMLMTMVDDKAAVYSSWLLQIICQRMWQMLYLIVPRLCTLCHLVTKMLCCPIILCMAPDFPLHLSITCSWLSTVYLLLDLYHARLCQDMHISHGLLLAGRSCRRSTKARVFNESAFLEVHIFNVCPLDLPLIFKSTYPWLLT